MLFKANFCAECGEKIGKEAFRLTNRFLCERCAVGQGNFYHIFSVVILICSLFGGYFIGSISQTPPKTPLAVVSQPANTSVNQTGSNSAEKSAQTIAQTIPKAANQAEKFPNIRNISANQANLSRPPQPFPKTAQMPLTQTVEVNEAAYYCGAKTQKGTPCMRKVKGGGRCWQHPGKPAMFPPEKLLIQP